MAIRREAWRRKQKRRDRWGFDPRRLVFLDETGAKTDMTRRYGWGLRHERVAEAVPHGRWRTTTLIHAIDVRGTRAAMITDGPTNAAVFGAFVEWLLAPQLRRGDVDVMDNLGSHKSARAVAGIEAAGAKVLYLPPYSPDLNPIEKVLSKVKAFPRSAAPGPRRRCTTPLRSRSRLSLPETAPTSSVPADTGYVKCKYALVERRFPANPLVRNGARGA